MYEKQIISINKHLKTDFEKDLLEAAVANLEYKGNPLRFHNFAYSIREFSRHLLYSLSPESEVLSSNWYSSKKSEGRATRRDRVKYAIQGRLSNDFVYRELFDKDDLEDIINSVVKLIELLSKYTHVNKEIFNLTERRIKELSDQIIHVLIEFVKVIEDTRKAIIEELSRKIQDEFIEYSLNQNIDKIEALATHHQIDYLHVEDVQILKIEANLIKIGVNGYIDAHLQFGSNSDVANDNGLETDESFPFEGTADIKLGKKLRTSKVHNIEIDVDTSQWYE